VAWQRQCFFHTGLYVTMLEKEHHVGGRTSTIHAGGFRFDRGPTFFLYPRILSEIFAQTGHDLFAEVEMRRLDPQYRLVFGGGGQIPASCVLASASHRNPIALYCHTNPD